MMKINPLTCIDFYKADHRSQYPEATEMVYSNFTPRSDKLFTALPDYWDGKVVQFGLQGFIKWFLIDTFNEEFFNKPKEEVVKVYKRRMDNSLGPGAITVEHIEELHDLGYLPIVIKALPEGERVDIKVPTFTVRNSQKGFAWVCFWITNYLESVFSSECWQPTTVATIAYEYRKILTKYAEETGAPLDFVSLQAHDFSFRGMGGVANASACGAGHLTSFIGTDTVPAIDYVENYYNADSDKEIVGVSVPATEHSVMCMGTKDGEIETFRRLINEVYPSGIVSIVSDTWDFWKVITEYLPELKEDILSRDRNSLGLSKVVIRPDSGDPVKILCGYQVGKYCPDFEFQQYDLELFRNSGCNAVFVNGKYYQAKVYQSGVWLKMGLEDEISLTEVKGAVECLWETFGGTTTEKGYKVLDEHIGLIYGDSITLQRADEILKRLKDKGFASCNVVFGVGSFSYSYLTRDSLGYAMKATYGIVNGEGREIFKDPVTDSGTKKSARGLLRVEKEGDNYVLYDQQTPEQEEQGSLQVVFEDGKLYNETSLSEIRSRLGW